MSLRIDADEYAQFTGLANLQTATLCVWVYLVANRGDYSTIADVTGGGVILQTGTDGASLILYDGTETAVTGGTLPVGDWVHLALVNTSATSRTVYVGGTSGLVRADGDHRWTQVRLGNDAFNEWADARLAHARLWSAALSQAEIAAEMASATAVRTTGLLADWPLASDLADASGNGRTLTGSGTLTFEAQPPLGGGGASVTLTPVTLSLAPQATTATPVAQLTPVALDLAPQALEVNGASPAAVTLSPVSLSLLPQPITPVGTTPASVTLSPVVLTLSAGATLGTAVEVTPVSLTLSPQPITTGSAASVTLTPITLTLSTGVTLGVALRLTPVALSLTPQAVTAQASTPASVTLSPVSLTLGPHPVRRGVSTTISPVSIQVTPSPLGINGSTPATVTLAPVSLVLLPRSVTAAGGGRVTLDPVHLGLTPQGVGAGSGVALTPIALTLAATGLQVRRSAPPYHGVLTLTPAYRGVLTLEP